MARSFSGTNQHIDFGSDTSIDDFVSISVSFWLKPAATGLLQVWINKASGPPWAFYTSGTSNKATFLHGWSTGVAQCDTNNVMYSTNLMHLAAVYDGALAANRAVIYQDGASLPVTSFGSPSGTLSSDAAVNLIIGETGGGAGDYNGTMGWVCYDNTLWTAAKVNRARWWGTPGGSIKVFHPLVTTDLNNHGSATANGTNTGTTMASIPRVERCWGSMMGCGR